MADVMGETLLFCPEPEDAGSRLDAFLALNLEGKTRSAVQKLMDQGKVLVNGKAGRKNDKVKPGDSIQVEIPEPEPLELLPQDIPLDIVYEDEHLLVVNKPKGMVVHPAPGNPDSTLVNALLYHCGQSLFLPSYLYFSGNSSGRTPWFPFGSWVSSLLSSLYHIRFLSDVILIQNEIFEKPIDKISSPLYYCINHLVQ